MQSVQVEVHVLLVQMNNYSFSKHLKALMYIIIRSLAELVFSLCVLF